MSFFPPPTCTILEPVTHSRFIVSIYILVKIMNLGAVESPLCLLCDTRLCSLTCKTGIMTVFTSQVSWEEQMRAADGKLSGQCLARHEPSAVVKHYHAICLTWFLHAIMMRCVCRWAGYTEYKDKGGGFLPLAHSWDNWRDSTIYFCRFPSESNHLQTVYLSSVGLKSTLHVVRIREMSEVIILVASCLVWPKDGICLPQGFSFVFSESSVPSPLTPYCFIAIMSHVHTCLPV